MKDYYAILELSPNASQEEIREQYLLLIQAWHPDKFPNAAQKAKAEEKCKQINIAYDVLKDAEKRARYDRDIPGQRVGPREGESWEAELRRHRRDAEAARQQATQRPHPPHEQAEKPRHETEAERQAREEEWTRVYFEQARRRQAGQGAAVSSAALEPIRVLLVDDAADTRTQIREMLSGDAQIRVVGEALNGLEAVRQFDALLPDVMVTSIDRPTLGSLAATEGVRRRHPLAKIIILSVLSSSDYIRQAALIGVCDYLTRPAPAAELRSAIRLAAGRGTT